MQQGWRCVCRTNSSVQLVHCRGRQHVIVAMRPPLMRSRCGCYSCWARLSGGGGATINRLRSFTPYIDYYIAPLDRPAEPPLTATQSASTASGAGRHADSKQLGVTCASTFSKCYNSLSTSVRQQTERSANIKPSPAAGLAACLMFLFMSHDYYRASRRAALTVSKQQVHVLSVSIKFQRRVRL